MKKHLLPALLFLSALGFAGCATQNSTDGVASLGGNTYQIARYSKAGPFADMSALRAKVVGEAESFASARGKSIEVISARTDTAAELRFPSFEYTFKLVDRK